MNCFVCCFPIATNELLVCSSCCMIYDYHCLGVTPDIYEESVDNPEGLHWQCLTCEEKCFFKYKVSDLETPDLDPPSPSLGERPLKPWETELDILNRKMKKLPALRSLTSAQVLLPHFFDKTKNHEMTELNEIMDEVQARHTAQLLSDPESSADISMFLKSFKAELDKNFEQLIGQYKPGFKPDLNNPRGSWYAYEKCTRDRNMLMLVPERPNENLFHILKALCKVIRTPLYVNEIELICRVPRRYLPSTRPAKILVTFSTPRHRDLIMMAYRKYNRDNREEPLTTAHVGVDGPVRKIYVSENITPRCKAILVASNKYAKECGYKYVYIKKNEVLVKKDDESPSILITKISNLYFIP